MKKIGVLKSLFTVLMTLLFSVVLVACESSEKVLAEALTNLEIGFVEGDSATAVTRDVTLPTSVEKVSVSWETSDENIISTSGVVKRVYKLDQAVTLTATLTFNKVTETKTFDLVVAQLVDTIPPAFMGAIAGKLTDVKHLAGLEIDLIEGIQARDNVDAYDVEITVDVKDYNPLVAGTYTVTYTAADKSNNKTNIDRTIIVEESLDVTVNAMVSGDSWAEYEYNNTNAFVSGGTYGATFRQFDKLQVMERDFYLAELAEHATEYPTSAGLPVLPYGVAFVMDENMTVIHARFQIGVFLELNIVEGETVLTHTDVIWNNGVGGGSALVGLDEIIPENGYVVFAPSLDPQRARIFTVSNLFSSIYTGGAGTKDIQDVFDLTSVELDLVEGHRVLIAKPDPVATPEITLTRHTLSWTAVPNAASYNIYTNGELFHSGLTTTSVDLSSLGLALSEDEGYDIQVVAVTKDVFKFSDSELSNVIKYKMINIQTIADPIVTLVGSTELTWEAVEGADYYEVYLKLQDLTKKVGQTDGTTFNVDVVEGHNGINNYYVQAIGKITHTDSKPSNYVTVNQLVVSQIVINGETAEVVVTTAEDYFGRRNTSAPELVATKLGNYLYLVTNVDKVEKWANPYNEGSSMLVLLDSELKVKHVRSVLGHSYVVGEGWTKETGVAQTTQTVGLEKYTAEGDTLLIGKASYGLTFTYKGETITRTASQNGAREFLGYHFAAPYEGFPASPVAPHGWRDPIANNHNPLNSTVELIKK